MRHTQEPWSVAEETFDNAGIKESVIRGMDHRAAIAVTLDFGMNNPAMREANAIRIVACVNACAGISQQYIEELNGETLADRQMTLIAQRDEYSLLAFRRQNILDGVIKQRDELLATLERLVIRCDGEQGMRADLSNIDTSEAHGIIERLKA